MYLKTFVFTWPPSEVQGIEGFTALYRSPCMRWKYPLKYPIFWYDSFGRASKLSYKDVTDGGWICAVEGWDNLTEGTGVAISQAYGRHVPCYPGSFYLGSNKNRRFSTVCNHLRGSRWCSKFWSIKSSELKGRFLLVLKLCCSCQFAVVLK